LAKMAGGLFACVVVSLCITFVTVQGESCLDNASKNTCLRANSSCLWCASEAVPGVCATLQQAKRLPPKVFMCSRSLFVEEVLSPRDTPTNCDTCKTLVKRAINWVGCGGEQFSELDCLALLNYSTFAVTFCAKLVDSFNTALRQACAQFEDQTQIDTFTQEAVCRYIGVCPA